MKESDKGLLAVYWAKTEKTKQPMMTHRDGDPYGNGRDGDYSNSPYTRGPDGKMISSLSIPNPVYGKPKKRGIHNALNPVASSVPRERPLKMMKNQGQMIATFSKADQELVKEGGGRINDKQRIEMSAKYGWYAEGMHPDSTTFGPDGNVRRG